MSFDYSFSFGPVTPPQFSYEDALNDASFEIPHHTRAVSQSSFYSQESSPDSINTQLTTPARSPIRQHGPLLLPKIRPQDQNIQAPTKRAQSPLRRGKKSPANKVVKSTSSTFRPSHTRSYTNPESISFLSTDFPSHTRSMSTLCSPISFAGDSPNDRRASSADLIDNQTLSRYGFPTYRQLPSYISTHNQIETFVAPQTFYPVQMPQPQRSVSPLQTMSYPEESQPQMQMQTISPIAMDNGETSTLMAYLTSPNPAPALVRQLNIHVRDTSAKHFWWDIRQIRPWTSFSMATITSIPGFSELLSINLPAMALPTPSKRSSQPETEAELANIYSAFYSTKVNAALSLSQGNRHLVMRPATATKQAGSSSDPTFISNYTDDTSQLIYGKGLGRVVGLVKSFDRWNTGMRVEGNHRKVEYLRGLAHLHAAMRANGCRYGYIMTEIELVVVRNGAEATPHFGYLEVQTIQLAAHNPVAPPSSSSSFDDTSSPISTHSSSSFLSSHSVQTPTQQQQEQQEQPQKLTALLSLWFLHMLARDTPLPNQPHYKAAIGAPAEGTRRKTLPKDEWIPEPQLAEKREGKRCRGWVWPEEAVGRKELGKRGVKYS